MRTLGLFLTGLVVTVAACNPVTPGIKIGGDSLTRDYVGMVRRDPIMPPVAAAEKIEIACNHRCLLGLDVPADLCPPCPEAE